MSGLKEWSEIRRLPEDGLVCGVCAGLAEYYGWRVRTVRFVVALLVLFVNWPVIFAYAAACFLLPTPDECEDQELERRGSRRRQREQARAAYRSLRKQKRRARHARNLAAEEGEEAAPKPRYIGPLKERYAGIEKRMRRVEAYLHGNEYELRTAFRDLERG